MTVLDRVRDRILSGAVPAGRPLRQDALAAELGVSKIPLREALGRLEQEGLVRAEANRGFFVRALSAAEAEEVYALRLTLEPEAAAAGALAARDSERDEAEAAVEALEQAIDAHSPAVGALNRAFHLALVRPAGREVTADILSRLHVLSERYVRMHLEPRGRDEEANAEHRALLSAWLARDGDAVAALSRAHLGRALEDLRRQLAFSDAGDD
ncbi:MAG TPA: GntR family transcriptional regulator [Allosphingosinicella sp.]|jgi:DNA-binding GntR family transcriptional regulator